MKLNYYDNYVKFNTELYMYLKKMNMACARPSPSNTVKYTCTKN